MGTIFSFQFSIFKRALLLLFSLITFVVLFPPKSLSQSEFLVDVNVTYDVNENGITQVTHAITLENLFSSLYATSYVLSMENIEPQNVQVYEGGKQLRVEERKENNTVFLEVTFDDAVVGKGKSRTFNISFEEDSFATKTGEVWEISIPRLSQEDSFRFYSVDLLIPVNFGNEAYLSPDPTSKTKRAEKLVYRFGKEAVAKTGITAGFGQFQVFAFTLKYHLENPLNRTATTEIAIPPDTAFQKLYYTAINPKPENVYVDEDGNWLAIYLLKPRARIDIEVLGSVQIFASPRSLPAPSAEILQSNLMETQYWQVKDPEIAELGARLGTPDAIYNFVTNNLTYNFERVRPNVQRFGAKTALQTPNSAICMEYTDLFVALTRAAGVPAREINGYAYTENPELQPLSLVADVLHAWPEYYSFQKNAWIPVDPTWGSTTGGVDYFNKLDLRHFTFVIHGQNPSKPYSPGSYKLGPNPEKDVFVSFGQLPEKRTSKPEILAEVQNSLPFVSTKVAIKIKNPGPIALYGLTPTILFDSEVVDSGFISVLPPYAVFEMKTAIPFSFLGTNTPNKVTILAADASLNIPSNKNQVIIYNLLALFLLFAVVVSVVILRFKKISLKEKTKSLFHRIKSNEDKKDKISQNNQGPD